MKILLLKQTDGFMMMTESAWENHLRMVKLLFMQEETSEDALILGEEYEKSFEIEILSNEQVKDYKKRFKIDINESRRVDSFFGTILHF